MRGIPSLITDIRKKVFTEVARMAYSGNGYEGAEDLPFKIVPGDQPLHRESIFLERAIAGERVRLAMGLSIRPVQTRSLMTEGMDAAAIAEQYYEPPLINIIPYACHACPTNQYRVTENCQNCLAASCQRVCPKGAVSFVNGKSHIDPKKCIKCGKCASACPYHAIIHMERPCQAACGMDAIVSDEHGRAKIDQNKCVACGQCLVSCPFGAIVDKGQIFQVIQSVYIIHVDNGMRISHGNAGKIKFPIQNFHCFTDNGMLVTQNGDFCRLQHRLTHVHSYAFHNAILYMQLQNLDAAQCFQCHRCFLRQSSFVNIFADTTRSVAAHFPLAAVRVEDAHPAIGPGGHRGADADDAVRTHGKMPGREPLCKCGNVCGHTGCTAVQIDVIIGTALHLGK